MKKIILYLLIGLIGIYFVSGNAKIDCELQGGLWVNFSEIEDYYIDLGIETEEECHKYGGTCSYVFKDTVTEEICLNYDGEWYEECEDYDPGPNTYTEAKCLSAGGKWVLCGLGSYCFALNQGTCEELGGQWVIRGCSSPRMVSSTTIGGCDFDPYYVDYASCWVPDFFGDTCLLPIDGFPEFTTITTILALAGALGIALFKKRR